MGSIERLRRTETVLVAEPPQTLVAVRVYLNSSSTGPSAVCVGATLMAFVPLASTEPSGVSEAASEFDDDQFSVVPSCSITLSPMRRLTTSSCAALNEDFN